MVRHCTDVRRLLDSPRKVLIQKEISHTPMMQHYVRNRPPARAGSSFGPFAV